MAFFLTHVLKLVIIGYPLWMVNMIHQTQVAARGEPKEEEHHNEPKEEKKEAKKVAHH